MTNYDDTFFEYVNSGALRSAQRVLPVLLRYLDVRSVVDVGCGQGAWLSVWREMGVQETVGLDGDYVRRERLLIPGKFFIPQNLSEEFDLGRRFDLVQSLEVAEHLPRSSGPRFVDSLVRHGDIIFFSAAPQGQGGDQHVNEQSYEYWRRHFERRDYVPIDLIRPNVIGDRSIEPWYRYNSFLYVSAEKLRHLPDAVQQCQTLGPLKDISPLPYKLRKLFLRLLPVPIITKLARIKEKQVARVRAR